MKTGTELISEERKKQINKHGFTAEHHVLNSDKWYSKGQLPEAACSLIYPLLISKPQEPENWDRVWFDDLLGRPHRERLIIAGALIAAELDRLELLECNETPKNS